MIPHLLSYRATVASAQGRGLILDLCNTFYADGHTSLVPCLLIELPFYRRDSLSDLLHLQSFIQYTVVYSMIPFLSLAKDQQHENVARTKLSHPNQHATARPTIPGAPRRGSVSVARHQGGTIFPARDFRSLAQ